MPSKIGIELTEMEARAVKAWLLDLSFSDPDMTLVNMDWSDEDIDKVKASLAKKLKMKWE